MLDALAEASRDLRQREGARTAVVALTSTGAALSHRPRERVVDEASGGGIVFLGVQFEAEQDAPESRFEYDYTLGALAKESGGLRENVLSSMALEPALRKLAGDLNGRYRVRYATPPDLKKRKLELQVARPGARVRVAEAAP
jgi:hypothetical protein